MAKNPGFQDTPFLPEPPPPYTPRTPPPSASVNAPPPPTLQGTLSSVGKEVGGYFKSLTRAGVKAINKALEHPNVDYIKNGNVVQFVSRSTGRTLQILQAPDGRLVLDGNGGEGHQFFNAHFTVVQTSDNYIMLHNNFNYISVVDGITQLFSAGPTGAATKACRFKVKEVLMQTQFVTIENASERGRFVGVLSTGQIKSALVTTVSDPDAHFAVRLIYSPLAGKVPYK